MPVVRRTGALKIEDRDPKLFGNLTSRNNKKIRDIFKKKMLKTWIPSGINTFEKLKNSKIPNLKP